MFSKTTQVTGRHNVSESSIGLIERIGELSLEDLLPDEALEPGPSEDGSDEARQGLQGRFLITVEFWPE